ncbi:ABC transporter permease subunit [Clostridia bacterium]|jgi:multiple sugar transport system permease protein
MNSLLSSVPAEATASGRKKWNRWKARHLTPQAVTSLLWKLVRAVILLGLCYIILYPFFIKVVNAFKTYSDFIDPTVRFLPKTFTWGNVRHVVKEMSYWSALQNTLLISVALGALQTLVCAVVGYGFARFQFKGRNLCFFLVIFSLIVPSQTILLPLYLKFKAFLGVFKLIGTAWPLVILSMTGLGIKNGLYIFMFRQFFRNMPKELEEASYLDGCGTLRTFTKIMLPAATAVMTTVFLLALAWQWTDTVFSPLFLDEVNILSKNVSALAQSAGKPIEVANYVNIGAVLAVLPIALIYIVLQKFFVESIDRAGIVG